MRKSALELDGYYIPTRYPNGLPDGIPANVFTQDAAQDAVAMASEAVGWVRQLLTQAKSGAPESG
jgi:HEPN domain-containing protein